jgi:hypothetical protein
VKIKTITEDYCSFEVAKLLKKNGFNEECWEYYDNNSNFKHFRITKCNYDNIPYKNSYIAPTHQMVLKWLREIHYLHVEISIGSDSSTDADGNTIEKWYYWTYSIRHTIDGHMIYSNNCLLGTEYQSYEDTVEASIKYCLTNLI